MRAAGLAKAQLTGGPLTAPSFTFDYSQNCCLLLYHHPSKANRALLQLLEVTTSTVPIEVNQVCSHGVQRCIKALVLCNYQVFWFLMTA